MVCPSTFLPGRLLKRPIRDGFIDALIEAVLAE